MVIHYLGRWDFVSIYRQFMQVADIPQDAHIVPLTKNDRCRGLLYHYDNGACLSLTGIE